MFLGKVERRDTYVLADGVQVVLGKCIRRTDRDWSKYVPINKSFNAFSLGVFGQDDCHQREQKHYQPRQQTFLEKV